MEDRLPQVKARRQNDKQQRPLSEYFERRRRRGSCVYINMVSSCDLHLALLPRHEKPDVTMSLLCPSVA